MDTADKKIATFLDLLEERTIDSIDKDLKINESCTATLLLIFAVIDSLGKITCSEDQYKKKKGNDQIRFTNFLEKLMGPSYAKFKDRLYYLRCDIVHTAINTKVIMSKDKHAYHLVEVNGILRINTSRFFTILKKR